MILGLDHIGVVVKDLSKAIQLFETLGLTVGEKETIEHLNVDVAFFKVNGNRIELISPLAEPHELQQHMKDHGEGLHHIAFKVGDMNESVNHLKNLGVRISRTRPRGKGHGGKEIAFLNEEDTCGMVIELCQEKR
jgi:methylmalonyl-CoA epimerase